MKFCTYYEEIKDEATGKVTDKCNHPSNADKRPCRHISNHLMGIGSTITKLYNHENCVWVMDQKPKGD